jgi:hypothetical protein
MSQLLHSLYSSTTYDGRNQQYDWTSCGFSGRTDDLQDEGLRVYVGGCEKRTLKTKARKTVKC